MPHRSVLELLHRRDNERPSAREDRYRRIGFRVARILLIEPVAAGASGWMIEHAGHLNDWRSGV
jgi:hypothetical protein